jgi:glycosyltransferase involved in cell wall biosynthesis
MMNNYPLVSIIACCYNHEKFVEETLDGIISQTYENIELIIIDDFSTDSSVKKVNNWIKKHKYECLFIQNTENLGVVKTLNKALKKCNGKYFSLIACDDIYLPKKTENQIKIFENLSEEFVAIYSDAYTTDENSSSLYGTQIVRKQINKPPSGNIHEDLIRKDNFIPAISVIYKIKIIKELGYYDESLIYEDYDMLLRLSKKYKIYFSKEIDVCYRLHQTNMNYNLDKPKFLDSKIKMLFKHLNVENCNLEIGIVLKEKILKLCELLFMQNSTLLKPHIKKLRSEYNYGKLLYYSSYLRLNWIIYLFFRILVLKKDQTVTLDIK